ncbi:MAG: helix-hairpin-helix domain-containing protein, partial [Achromobacter sp.]|nr:helix-hairpin-helix domain-containing protein [Achromobacter sp.]
MNPFLHSAVARPRLSVPWRRINGPGRRPPQGEPGIQSTRRALRRAMGVLLMTAGLGLAAAPAGAVDVNQASAQQLESVRGIGPRTAETIVRERERGGKFESLDDLAERVRGISPKKAEALGAAGLTVGGAKDAGGAAKPAIARPAASVAGAGTAAVKGAVAGGAAAK